MDSEKWRILIVDDEPNNLQLMKKMLHDRYQLAFANNGLNALEVVRKVQPDLILLDIMMPEMDGYETCRRLKADPLTAKIPVIFVTAMNEIENESHGFEVGGVDYIAKPFSPPILQSRVATHLALYDQQRACEKMISKRTAELEASQQAAIYMLGEAGEYNDTDTGLHIWRMASYSAAIARALGWKAEQVRMLNLAAPMHDAGKIGIPDAILKKPGKLDAEEWNVMRTHSFIGHSILSKSNTALFHMASEIAFYHHEKWDGSGYPKRLRGDAIPECARIVAIADVFDALTMKRPYKEAWPVEDALAEIRKTSGSHFDPDIVECFFSVEDEIMTFKKKWGKRENEEINYCANFDDTPLCTFQMRLSEK